MRKILTAWVVGVVMALALVSGLGVDYVQPPVVHGEETTPTPTATTEPNGEPGGSGGGRN